MRVAGHHQVHARVGRQLQGHVGPVREQLPRLLAQFARFWSIRRTALLTWPARKPPFYGLYLLLGVVLVILGKGQGWGNGGATWPFGPQEVVMRRRSLGIGLGLMAGLLAATAVSHT